MGDLRLANDGVRRTAETLLRGTGGRAVFLRVPAPADATNIDEQLGLTSPEFNDLELSPVVFRKALPQVKTDGPRWELLVSAISVAGLVGTTGVSDAVGLFADAFGVLVGDSLMQIQSVSTSDMDGSPYVYRLLLRPPAVQAI